MTERLNVILLSIDALRADHLGYHGYYRNTTSFLDQLADQTICFKTAISASSHTREAVPALLSGEYPDIFAANGYRHTTETAADRLSTNGYRTAGFHSNPYVSRAYGFDSGFDTFDDDLHLGSNRYIALIQRAIDKYLLNKGEYHARAETINQRSLEWLDTTDTKPFFLWNHYMDPHGPYNPPDEYTFAEKELSNNEAHDLYQKIINRPDEVTDEQRELLIDSYDGEIRYLDGQLKKFFQDLEKRELVESSLIIVTADHGDAFGEHGYYTHPRYLHESLIHVPLLISMPELGAHEVDYPVSTLDIVPTILAHAGVENDDLPGNLLIDNRGRSILDQPDFALASAQGENNTTDIRRFAIRGRRLKIHLERNIETGSIVDSEIFDLKNDSGEQEPVTEGGEEVDNLLQILKEHSRKRIGKLNSQAALESPEESTEEIEDRLKALGYK